MDPETNPPISSRESKTFVAVITVALLSFALSFSRKPPSLALATGYFVCLPIAITMVIKGVLRQGIRLFGVWRQEEKRMQRKAVLRYFGAAIKGTELPSFLVIMVWVVLWAVALLGILNS